MFDSGARTRSSRSTSRRSRSISSKATLFGHQRGAFTGAARSREGLFRSATDGTLFLDEIGELPLALQAKILRVLEEKEMLAVGSDRPIRVEARVLAATHRDLDAMVKQGTFRQDLLFRLNTVVLKVPALRERREDIPLLVRQFVDQRCYELARPPLAISDAALECLVGYDWSKGNVRELSNVIEHAVIFCDSARIETGDLPECIRETALGNSLSLDRAVQEFERSHIASVLANVGGDTQQAARLLGISRATLYRRIHGFRLVTSEPGNHDNSEPLSSGNAATLAPAPRSGVS